MFVNPSSLLKLSASFPGTYKFVRRPDWHITKPSAGCFGRAFVRCDLGRDGRKAGQSALEGQRQINAPIAAAEQILHRTFHFSFAREADEFFAGLWGGLFAAHFAGALWDWQVRRDGVMESIFVWRSRPKTKATEAVSVFDFVESQADPQPRSTILQTKVSAMQIGDGLDKAQPQT